MVWLNIDGTGLDGVSSKGHSCFSIRRRHWLRARPKALVGQSAPEPDTRGRPHRREAHFPTASEAFQAARASGHGPRGLEAKRRGSIRCPFGFKELCRPEMVRFLQKGKRGCFCLVFLCKRPGSEAGCLGQGAGWLGSLLGWDSQHPVAWCQGCIWWQLSGLTGRIPSITPPSNLAQNSRNHIFKATLKPLLNQPHAQHKSVPNQPESTQSQP